MAPRTTRDRKTAAERREQILDAAVTEFASLGYAGASTDVIARSVDLSQPYLFRLFGTKKQLFIECVRRCMADELERFREASEGLRGTEALGAIGGAYVETIRSDPRRLQAQMQAYAACDDPEIAAVVREGYGRLVAHCEDLGATPEQVAGFFAKGMLMNVMASMGLPAAGHEWSARLLASACDL
jgi:AcrR family transcriptional regulator